MTDIKALSRNIRKQSIFEKLDIPRPGLKLLVDPAEQLGTASGEKLGPNLVKNGDFSDFTMGSVAAANLKGHWIFNDKYAIDKSHPAGDQYCASFDGVDDYFYLEGVNSTDLLPGTGDATISYWFLKDPDDSHGVLIHKGNWGAGYWATGRMNSETQLLFRFYDGGNRDCVAATWSTLSVGWHQVAFVVNRSIGTNGAVLAYLDGKFVTSLLINTATNLNNSGRFVIAGADQGVVAGKDIFSDFGYWNRALNSSEIINHSKGIIPSNPVAYYKFDSSIQANNITDKSGNGHTLSVNGAPSYVSGKTRAINQDWSQGGAIWTGNLVSESSPNASEFTDNGTTWWTASRGTFSHNSGTQDATFTVTDDTGQLRIEKTGIITQGTRVRVSFRAKSAHTTSKMSLNGESAYFADVLEVANPNLSSSYQEYIFEGYVGSANKLTIIFPDDLVNGQSVTIDSIKCQKPGGAGNHLGVASTYDVSSKFIEDAPNYKDGKSLRTEGTGQYLFLGAASCADFIPGTGSFSFGIKLKINGDVATGSDGYFGWVREGFNLGTGPHWVIRRYYDGRIMTQMAPAAGGPYLQTFSSATYSSANGWLTVIATYDHTTGTLKLYINGVEVGSNSWTPVEITDGTSYLQIMRPFSGTIFADFAEAAYWNKALSESEVKQAYGLANGWEINSALPTTGFSMSNQGFKQHIQSLVSDGTSDFGYRQLLSFDNDKLYKAVIELDSVDTNNRIDFRVEYSSGSHVNVLQLYSADAYQTHHLYFKGNTGYPYIAAYISNVNSTDRHYTVKRIAVHEVLTGDIPSSYIPNLAEKPIREVSSELVTAMTNGGTYNYETFASNGNNILLATNTTAYGGCASNLIAAGAGKKYRVKLEVKNISGSAPDIRITTANNGRATVRYYLEDNAVSGYKEFVFQSANTESLFLEISNNSGETTSFSVFDISIKEVEYDIIGGFVGSLETGQPAHPYAFKFDGVNDYVNFGNVCDVGVSDFVLFSWVKVVSFGIDFGIIGKRDASSPFAGYALEARSTNSYRIKIDDGINDVQSDNAAGSGEWLLVTMSVKRGSVTGLKFYSNGVLVSITDITSVTGSLSSNQSLWIGRLFSAYINAFIGLSGIYIFDGQNGAPDALPADYENWIRRIYNSTKDRYNSSLPKVSLNKAIALKTWTPDLHKSALRLMVDPYRQQKAGWNNSINNRLVLNYANEGLVSSLIGPNPHIQGPFTSGVAAGWEKEIAGGFAGTFTEEVSLYQTGGSSQKIALSSEKFQFKTSSNISLQAGKAYKLSVTLRADFAATDLKLGISTVEGDIQTSTIFSLTANYWTVKNQIFVATTNHSSTGNIRIRTDTAQTGNIWIDAFFIEQLSENTQGITNGSLESTAWGTHEASMLFDGVNDWVSFGNVLNPGLNSFMLFAWTKNSQSSISGRIWSKQITSPLSSFYVSQETNGTFRVGILDNAILPNVYSSVYSKNTWHLVCAVFDRSGLLKIYVDGVLDPNSVDITALSAINVTNTDNLQYGGWTSSIIQGELGIGGMYLFDGQDGAASAMPADYEDVIDEIYESTKAIYGIE